MEIRKLLPGKFDNLVRNYEFSNKEIHKKWWEMFLHSWKIYIFSSRDDKLIFPCSLVLHLAYFQGHKQVLHHFLYHCILELMHLLICSLLRVLIHFQLLFTTLESPQCTLPWGSVCASVLVCSGLLSFRVLSTRSSTNGFKASSCIFAGMELSLICKQSIIKINQYLIRILLLTIETW